jgi:splicing factor 3A subunit 1
MLPPLHYQGLDAPQPFGYQPPPPAAVAMHPARLAALTAAGSLPPSQTGTVRSADEMEGLEAPPAKRQKIPKLPGGQFYPEADWINMHPVCDAPFTCECSSDLIRVVQHSISLQIELPNDPSKPEWKLDGSVVTIPDLPLNLLVSTLRDRFIYHTQSAVPASRIRLSYAGKMLTNASSIASYNLEDEDLLVLSVGATRRR